MDEETQAEHLGVEALVVDAGLDAGAEAGHEDVRSAEQVGRRNGHNQVLNLCHMKLRKIINYKPASTKLLIPLNY